MFFKNNKWKILISSIATLSPIIFGIIAWDILPEKIATHWGIDGQANGWSSPLFAVLFLPIFLFFLNLLCLFITSKDKKNRNQNPKAMNVIFCIMPVLSLYTNGIIYATAFGLEFNMMAGICILLGVMFIAIGNYMPKVTQSRTYGIKVKWALANEENWYATHRFAGKIYFVVGAALLLCAFLPSKAFPYVAVLTILVAAILPTIYSYNFYKKQLREGSATKEDYKLKTSKIGIIITAVLITAVLVFCGILMFTGNVNTQCGDTSFTVEASYHNDITVNYKDIESIEFREDYDAGERIMGFGSPRLSLGNFKNEEFGNYTSYAYTQCDACIVIKINGKILVLNSIDTEQTRSVYNEIYSRWEAQK